MFERLRLRYTRALDRSSSPMAPATGLLTPIGEHLVSLPEAESLLRSVTCLQRCGWLFAFGQHQSPAVVGEACGGSVDETDPTGDTPRTALDRVRTVVRKYGRQLRLGGVRPEHLVPPVRRAMQEAAAMAGIERTVARDIVRAGVLWGIQGYYGTA